MAIPAALLAIASALGVAAPRVASAVQKGFSTPTAQSLAQRTLGGARNFSTAAQNLAPRTLSNGEVLSSAELQALQGMMRSSFPESSGFSTAMKGFGAAAQPAVQALRPGPIPDVAPAALSSLMLAGLFGNSIGRKDSGSLGGGEPSPMAEAPVIPGEIGGMPFPMDSEPLSPSMAQTEITEASALPTENAVPPAGLENISTALLGASPEDPYAGLTTAPSNTGPGSAIPGAAPEGGIGTASVQEGDTLWAIAERLLGDGNLWPLLWEANARRLGMSDPNQIQAGVDLQVPLSGGMDTDRQAQARGLADNAMAGGMTPELANIRRMLLGE